MSKEIMVEVIASGINGVRGPVAIGTKFPIKGDIPPGWAAKVRVFSQEDPKGDLRPAGADPADLGGGAPAPVAQDPGSIPPAPIFTRDDGTAGTAEDLDEMDRSTMEALAAHAGKSLDGRLGDAKYREALKAALFGAEG